MSTTTLQSNAPIETAKARNVDLKLEAVVIPVSDVDRAKGFYSGLGWRLDADFARGDDFRVVQFTPPGSQCSIHFGKGVTPAAPGSAHVYLVVSDIMEARAELIDRGVDVDEVFHNGPEGRRKGLDPKRSSYASFTSFGDPDGNRWLLQEVTVRLPGRVDANVTTFDSPAELAAALRRAAAAHGEHEKRTGQHDVGWPDWYAEYMVQEQAGKPLPS
jgi:catechol 2,3-dioxygenase-like lactoylglutathione lyase family enzyme